MIKRWWVWSAGLQLLHFLIKHTVIRWKMKWINTQSWKNVFVCFILWTLSVKLFLYYPHHFVFPILKDFFFFPFLYGHGQLKTNEISLYLWVEGISIRHQGMNNNTVARRLFLVPKCTLSLMRVMLQGIKAQHALQMLLQYKKFVFYRFISRYLK